MKNRFARRLLAAFLALVLVTGLTPAAFAQNDDGTGSAVSWKEVGNDTVTASLEQEEAEVPEEASLYDDEEQVRVSIVLEDEPAASIFSTDGIGQNEDAADYRDSLQAYQEIAAEYISEQALDGEELDVVWNLTLAVNAISANVEYGKVKAIRELDGVEDVFVEQRHEIQGFREPHNPQMEISTDMTGTTNVWNSGYTGAGMRVAIIDTGLDIQHQSVNNDAFLHALEEDVAKDDSVSSMADYDLLDKEEITGLLSKLNAYKRVPSVSVDNLYRTEKIPFGFNYIDNDTDVGHVNDTQGEHGSHVAGTSAANRYLKKQDGSFVSAMEEVHMTGNAPDAQILVMKVFGKGGGAYDSDYIAAIEDAIVLGCDSVNLSLGSPNAGFVSIENSVLQKSMENLTASDTVVVFSASNSYYWANKTTNGELYSEDVNFQTAGSSGTCTNVFTVAAVENNGVVGAPSPKVNGKEFSYNSSTSQSGKPLTSLDPTNGNGTEYDYVFIDGYGSMNDYTGLTVTNKVVFVSRGTDGGSDGTNKDYANFWVKAQNAHDKGAAAVVVYNNQAGEINMDLTGYTGNTPAISIKQDVGQMIKADSTPVEGNSKAYTGKIIIYGGIKANPGTATYETFCDFSSWGVPGNLSMKPEITAPGGNIWSLNGSHHGGAGGTDQYELMSGTSMAAPQIAGISALVKQYIEEQNLSQKGKGITDRALIQSLMMSTATPLVDAEGNYYSILQQGAGMVNTAKAASADSYIQMGEDATASWKDGKVKVELGDDPDYAGDYTFSFSINNLDGKEHTYEVSADIFTQDVESANGDTYMSRSTKKLSGALATFEVVGSSGSTNKGLSYDFDGNGVVNLSDGTALLDYVTGKRSFDSLFCRENAYFGRNVVDSYSAHLFLNERAEVIVPAGGSVTVRANIKLNKAEMDALLRDCKNGAYIEAFVKIDAESTAEGVESTSHVIPVLGFYGCWTDSSMFDKNDYTDIRYDTASKLPYLQSVNGDFSNYLVREYAGDSAGYYFGGNPYTGETDDTEYLPARNALNNQKGDKLTSWYYSLIRNARVGRVQITDAGNNTVYYEKQEERKIAAFYSYSAGQWNYTRFNMALDWAGTDANGNKLPEDTVVNLTLSMVPELYTNNTSAGGPQVNWGALGEGASLTSQVTIDNTAPQVVDENTGIVYNKDKRTLTVTAKDNQYIAAAVLFTADGAGEIEGTRITPNQRTKGEVVTMELPLEWAVGSDFKLQIIDYAGNVRTYDVTLNIKPEGDIYYSGLELLNDRWAGYSSSGGKWTYLGTACNNGLWAGAYAKGYVFAFDTNNNFYAMKADDLSVQTLIAPNVGPSGNYAALNYVLDMAYDKKTDTMYLVGAYNGGNTLATVDLFTGAFTWHDVTLGKGYLGSLAVAVSDDGTIYALGGDFALYQISVSGANYSATKVGDTGITALPGFHSMTWDSGKQELLLAANGMKNSNGWAADGKSVLYTLDTQSGTATQKTELDAPLTALFTPAPAGEAVIEPTDTAESIVPSDSSVNVVRGSSVQLSAMVRPWTLTNKALNWSSSDSAIASVDSDGVVTANAAGTATITVSSAATPSISATCSVTVVTIDREMNALIWYDKAETWWSTLPKYTPETNVGVGLSAATETTDGQVYAVTFDNDKSTLYSLDSSTHVAKEVGAVGNGVVDMADAPNAWARVDSINRKSLIGVYGTYLLWFNKDTGETTNVFNLGDYGLTKDLVGIAYAGAVTPSNEPNSKPLDTYYLIDTAGTVYWTGIAFTSATGLTWFGFGSSNIVVNTGYTSGNYYYSPATYGMVDGSSSYLFWSLFDGDNTVDVLAIDVDGAGQVANLGSFESGVWPVALVTEAASSGATASVMSENLLLTTAQTIAVEMEEPDQVEDDVVEESPRDDADVIQPEEPEENMPVEPEPDVTEPEEPGLEATEPEEPEFDENVPEEPGVDDSEPGIDGDGDETGTMSMSIEAAAANGNASVEGSVVTVKVNLEQASTNGKVEISYDSSILTLIGADTMSTIGSVNSSTVGKVVLAYAYRDAAAAGSTVAELTFTSMGGSDQTVVRLATLEDGPEASDAVKNLVITLNNTGIVPPGPFYPIGGGSTEPDTDDTDDTDDGAGPVDPVTPPPEIVIDVPEAPAEEKIPEILAPFEDLDSDSWYSEYAAYMIDNGLMGGTGNGNFSPDEPLTRGMLVTILHRAAGTPQVPGETNFGDVEDGSWYADGVVWAEFYNLVNGYDDGTFRPNGSITRQELAVVLWRLAQKAGIDVSNYGTVLPEFPDRDQIAPWAGEAISWAYRAGILGGYEDGSLAPAAGATRMEAVAMLVRFLNLIENNPGE